MIRHLKALPQVTKRELVNQVARYTEQSRKVVLETGTTKTKPISDDTIVMIKRALIEQDIPQSLFEVNRIP
jgi:hypothetical protein